MTPNAEPRGVEALDWWHTIELPGGVVTRGGWDLRRLADRLLPPRLDGLRCLDVGTFDGFWAFELERRGAAEIVAIDVVEPRPTFRTAAELLGSRVEYGTQSVYDVSGAFDLVVMGWVLQFVHDPLRALAALRGACRGELLLIDTISLPLALLPAPLARLSARRGYTELFVFNPRGLKRAAELSGFESVAVGRPFRDPPGPGAESIGRRRRALHTAGILGVSAALRAR